LCAGFGDEAAQGVAVIGFVGDDASLESPAGNSGAVLMSWTSPPVRTKRNGRPSASVRVWILVVNPPRERPRA
jgi:hypothetical protein